MLAFGGHARAAAAPAIALATADADRTGCQSAQLMPTSPERSRSAHVR
jgi:hypothetical protein